MGKKDNEKTPNKTFYKTITKPTTSELIIANSRFIANAFPIDSIDKAKDFIREIQEKYHNATHNCFAFTLGVNNDYFRYNDNGEPQGTAGKPIYNAILHFGLTDVLVLVTRYFGGIKLGTSGLINAYFESTRHVLSLAEIIEVPITKTLYLDMDYECFPKIQHLLYQQTRDFEEYFSDKVEIFVQIPITHLDSFIAKINNISNGKIKFEVIEKSKGK